MRRRRFEVVALSLVMLLGSGLAGAPRASAVLPGEDKLDFGWKYLGFTCERSDDGLRLRYVVKARMVVNNDPGFGRWATEMSFKARLVASSAGTNISRDWSTRTYSTPLNNQRYSQVHSVTTAWFSASKDWRLQMKYIWDRPAPVRNVTRTFKSSQDVLCAPNSGQAA